MPGRTDRLAGHLPSAELTVAERLKFSLLSSGIEISPAAARVLDAVNEGRPMTPADYASTTGLILCLADEVWVNTPIAAYNSNFVETPPHRLDLVDGGLAVITGDEVVTTSCWLPPDYHGRQPKGREPWNHFVFTHGDRVRLSPVQGCAMTCKFCNIPYEDRYGTKSLGAMIEALHVAMADPVQPARHILISGGTPRADDVPYLRDVYRAVLAEFTGVDVDIMMVPIPGLLDVRELRDLGVHDLSINIEVHDPTQARVLMPRKFRQGLDSYLRFIEDATGVLGKGRVRSMLMVGLEQTAETLAGVRAVVSAGGVPVLSPFRPDPATPLRDHPLMTAMELEEIYHRASALARIGGAQLGPDCAPCTHNTLAFAPHNHEGHGSDRYPRLVMVR